MKMCYCCGKKGHMSPKCPEKDRIPKEDWAIRMAEQHMQAEPKKDNDEASQSDKSSKKTRWSGMQVCLMDKKKGISSKMKDDIILNNGSTLSIFANPELVKESESQVNIGDGNPCRNKVDQCTRFWNHMV